MSCLTETALGQGQGGRAGLHGYAEPGPEVCPYHDAISDFLDGELENALKYAAERGVDVRIILPGVPIKYIPFALALTHYRSLLESGVKIYEYTPGFVHAKVFVCDDREAVVGTINLDYRSLYHHFECATYL